MSDTRRFAFLMFHEYEELDLIGPWEMATMWRDYADGPECFTVSENGGAVKCAKGLKTEADHSFADCPDFDYLLIPGGFSAFDEMQNNILIDWVKAKAQSAEHVLSVCTGSFILYAAGLLEGRKATTHWKGLDRMKEFPGVTTVEKRWVRDGNVWSSAGVSAGIDLTLGFIAAIDGDDAAASVQHNAEYYPEGIVYGDGGNLAARRA
ncbi:DJ-1/PfpI family protein [Minwuia sp.]|uniref:DJ-1/PfpI family protein n=1 Tax=Minwuia sp. TaxID=2493630 RepID=UPI003A90527C